MYGKILTSTLRDYSTNNLMRTAISSVLLCTEVLTNIISGLGRVGEGSSRIFYDFVLVQYIKQPIFFILKTASASELFSRL